MTKSESDRRPTRRRLTFAAFTALLAFLGGAGGSYVGSQLEIARWRLQVEYSTLQELVRKRIELTERTVRLTAQLGNADLLKAAAAHAAQEAVQLQRAGMATVPTIDAAATSSFQLNELQAEVAAVLTLDALYFGRQTKEAVVRLEGALKASNPWWRVDAKHFHTLLEGMEEGLLTNGVVGTPTAKAKQAPDWEWWSWIAQILETLFVPILAVMAWWALSLQRKATVDQANATLHQTIATIIAWVQAEDIRASRKVLFDAEAEHQIGTLSIRQWGDKWKQAADRVSQCFNSAALVAHQDARLQTIWIRPTRGIIINTWRIVQPRLRERRTDDKDLWSEFEWLAKEAEAMIKTQPLTPTPPSESTLFAPDGESCKSTET